MRVVHDMAAYLYRVGALTERDMRALAEAGYAQTRDAQTRDAQDTEETEQYTDTRTEAAKVRAASLGPQRT